MATVGESSSTQKEGGEKPVIVRVKRKVGQSPFDAFCKFLLLSLSLSLTLFLLCGKDENLKL